MTTLLIQKLDEPIIRVGTIGLAIALVGEAGAKARYSNLFWGTSEAAIEVAGKYADVYALRGESVEDV